MKINILSVLMLMVLCAPFEGMAETVQFGSVTYEYEHVEGGVALTRGSVLTSSLPDELGGQPVVEIGARAFSEKSTSLSCVTIPSCVRKIGPYAFFGCRSVEEFVLNEGLVEVGEQAFRSCDNARFNGLPSTVRTIGPMAFAYTRMLNLSIPEGVADIGSGAFYYCRYLWDVALPSTITNIGSSAFKYTPLGKLKIPASVQTIGNEAFLMCLCLTNVVFDGSIPQLGSMAFKECDGLADANGLVIVGQTLFDAPLSGSVDVPSGVKVIGERAFYPETADRIDHFTPSQWEYHNQGVKSTVTAVTLPEGLEEIGESAFYYCRQLESVNIPSTVQRIGDGAFSCCCALQELLLPDSVDALGAYVFDGCSELTTARLPSSLTSLPYSTFQNCAKLSGLILPPSVTSIGRDAFNGCTALSSIAIPSGVTSIGARAFSNSGVVRNRPSGLIVVDGVLLGCASNSCPEKVDFDAEGIRLAVPYAFSSVTNGYAVVLSAAAKSVPSYLFAGSNSYYPGTITEVTIPEGVTNIEAGAFRYCSRMKDVKIPESVTEIKAYAFDGCAGLTNVVTAARVIGDSAFGSCESVRTVTLDEGVEKIGNQAFGCRKLNELSIPSTLRTVLTNAFSYWSSMSWNQPDVKVLRIPSWDSWYDIDFASQYSSPVSYSTQFVIGGQSVSVTNLTVPASVKILKPYVLGGLAMSVCGLPQGLEEIADNAFYNCYDLRSLNVPSSVTRLGASFIGGNYRYLNELHFEGNAPTVNASAFGWCMKKCVVYVLRESTGWNCEIPGTWLGCEIRYETQIYSVAFDLGTYGTRSSGGELAQSVEWGRAAIAPEVAANDGWRFTGWNTAFDHVESNLTVTARWTPVDSSDFLIRSVRGVYAVTSSVDVAINGTSKTDLLVCVPYPENNAYQGIAWMSEIDEDLIATFPETDDKLIRYAQFDSNLQSVSIRREFVFTNWSVVANLDMVTNSYPYDTSSDLYRTYTRVPTGANLQINPTNEWILARRDEILDDVGDDDYLAYARAAYALVASQFSYRLDELDLETIVAKRGGQCGGLTAVVVSLLRANGIPSRPLVGVRPDGTYHVWGEFYLQGYGWVPFDVTQDLGKSTDFGHFGLYDDSCIVMSRDMHQSVTSAGGRVCDVKLLQKYAFWWWYYGSSVEVSISFALHGDPVKYAVDINGVVDGDCVYGQQVTAATFVEKTEGYTNIVCKGWIGTGDVPATGVGTQVTFTVTQASSLKWLYQTNYWVSVDAESSPRQEEDASSVRRGEDAASTCEGGTVALYDAERLRVHGNSGWFANGTNLTAEATANEGWLFAGWRTVDAESSPRQEEDASSIRRGGDAASTCAFAVSTPLFLEALFTQKVFSVTFDLGEHGMRTGGGEFSQSVVYGESAVSPEVAANEGWRFTGWDSTFDCVMGNLTVTAQYEQLKYTVDIDGVIDGDCVYGQSVTAATFAEKTEGYTNIVCRGWIGTGDVPATGVGTQVTFTVTQASSLKWLYQTNYWVSVDAESSPRQEEDASSVRRGGDAASTCEGGTVALYDAERLRVHGNSGWFANGTNLTAEATANAGWLFAGWRTVDAESSPRQEEDASSVRRGGDAASTCAFVVRAPIFLKAEFVENAYAVCFDTTAGAGAMDHLIFTYGKVYNLPPCTATPPVNKHFAGWACSNGKRYDDGVLVFNLAKPGETVTMTAIWE